MGTKSGLPVIVEGKYVGAARGLETPRRLGLKVAILPNHIALASFGERIWSQLPLPAAGAHVAVFRMLPRQSKIRAKMNRRTNRVLRTER